MDRRTLGTIVAWCACAVIVLDVLAVDLVDGRAPIGGIAIAASCALVWRPPHLWMLRRVAGSLGTMFGTLLIAGLPWHDRGDIDLVWHYIPIGVPVLIAGLALRATAFTPEERHRNETARERVQGGPFAEARARLVMIEDTGRSANAERDPVAMLDIEFVTGRTGRATFEQPVPVLYASRLAIGEVVPVRVGSGTPPKIEIDWTRWNDELRARSSASRSA